MALAFNEIVSSPVFRFLVGKDQKPMTVHTALVARQSATLEKLVSGSMEEAQTRTVVWEDVDEDTFGLFAQFVYTGNYNPPVFVTDISRESSRVDLADLEDHEVAPDVPVPLPVEVAPQNGIDDDDSFWSSHKSSKTKKKKGSEPEETGTKNKFHNLAYPLPAVSTEYANKCIPRGNKSAKEDFTPVFLGHARLYAFADKYDIESLKALVLNKLHATLCKFSLYEIRYGDVVELIRYTYENTPSRTPRDSLRELVTHYVAYEAKQVAGSDQGLSLVEENGSFARDLLSMVLKRIA